MTQQTTRPPRIPYRPSFAAPAVREQNMKKRMVGSRMVREAGKQFRTSVFFGLLVALVVPGLGAAAEAQNPLATSDQKQFEEQALRILASSVVQQQKKVIEGAFSEDPWAQTPEGKATLASSVDE